MDNKRNFTLAEVLISLGIIGVISALTIPNLTHKIRTKILEKQFKVSISKLNEAIKRAKYELDVDTFGKYCVYRTGSNTYPNRDMCVTELTKVYNQRGSNDNPHRSIYKYDINRSNQIKNFNGTKNVTSISNATYPIIYQAKMLDGTYIGSWIMSIEYRIGIDINGDKGPNKFGHDIFYLYIDNSNDTITGFKWDGTNYTQEDIEAMEFSSSEDWYKARVGYPCSKTSPQIMNGIGCGWYAVHDICPFDDKPGYFRCLP